MFDSIVCGCCAIPDSPEYVMTAEPHIAVLSLARGGA